MFGLELKKIKRGAIESFVLINKLPASLTGDILIWCVCVCEGGGGVYVCGVHITIEFISGTLPSTCTTNDAILAS